MRSLLTVGLALGLVVAWPVAAAAQLEVVATLPDLASLAEDVGGEHVRVQALVSSRQDPHYTDARPSYVVALNRADLLIVNGMEMEVGWLPPLLTQARNPAINVGQPGYLDASETIEPLGVPAGPVTRAMGDIHVAGNPHFVLSPVPMLEVVGAIRDRLIRLDSDNAAAYRANAERVEGELRELAEELTARFAELPAEQRRVVPYHASTLYLTSWLGLEEVIHVEPVPGIAPSPGHVARVLNTMRAEGAWVIIQEEYYPTSTSETLARLVGGELVVMAGGTRFADGQRYPERLRELAEQVYAALARGNSR